MVDTVTLEAEQLEALAERVAKLLRKPMREMVQEPEDLSDHLDEQLREAFRPKGQRMMVKLKVRYTAYMPGEVVEFPQEEAERIVSKGWGTTATEVDVTVANLGRVIPVRGVKFAGRYKQFMPGDIAALSEDEAARVVALTFRDERKNVLPLSSYVALSSNVAQPGAAVLAREQAQGHGGRYPQGDADNQGAIG